MLNIFLYKNLTKHNKNKEFLNRLLINYIMKVVPLGVF